MQSICTNTYANIGADASIIINWIYEGVGWIELAQSKVEWQKFTDTLMRC